MRRPPTPLEIDPLATAATFGALAGALSLVSVFFDGLTLALAALAACVWTMQSVGASRVAPLSTSQGATVLAGCAVIATAWGWLFVGRPLGPGIEGVVLGSTGPVLWWVRRVAGRAARGRG